MSKFSINITASTGSIIARTGDSTFYKELSIDNKGACHGLLSIGVGNYQPTGNTLALQMNRKAKLSIKFDGYYDGVIQCGVLCINSADINAAPRLAINASVYDFNGSNYKQISCPGGVICNELSFFSKGSGDITTNILDAGQIIYIFIYYDIIVRGFEPYIVINKNSYKFTIQEIL